ncbi:MAG TPA: FMN reductase [Holosporales bacterium]|nr:FMN reductase [Holosporales bacterium]
MAKRILCFSGSARKDSLNKKLALLVCSRIQDSGAEATYIDLADFELPLYNGDLESASGIPENAVKLKRIFCDHDGLFIASPEHNSSYSALLKNTIDWISRVNENGEAPLNAFLNKVAAIAAVSPAALGGYRGLIPLRLLLNNIGITVAPSQLSISDGFNAFSATGSLNNEHHEKLLIKIIDSLLKTTIHSSI